MALDVYHHVHERLLAGDLPDLNTATINCVLLDGAHSIDLENTTLADIDANEVSGDGYDAGGQAVNGTTVSRTDGVTELEGTDVLWENSTITADYAAIYEADSGSDYLIGVGEFSETEESSDGDFEVDFTDNVLVEFEANPA